MKRFFLIYCQILAAIALMFSHTQLDAQNRLQGDVNGDGRISVADFTTVVEIINGHAQDLYGVADLNHDGKVDAQDLSSMSVIALTPVSSSTMAIINGQEVEVEWIRLTEGGPKWAVVNVGATDVQEVGTLHDWNSDNVWGPNWRKPTLDELFALSALESEYMTYQGSDSQVLAIGGEKGTLLYLPLPKSSGTQYWTSNEERSFVLENGVYKRVNWGCYFEWYLGAEGLEYGYDTDPKSTKKYLRLVVND